MANELDDDTEVIMDHDPWKGKSSVLKHTTKAVASLQYSGDPRNWGRLNPHDVVATSQRQERKWALERNTEENLVDFWRQPTNRTSVYSTAALIGGALAVRALIRRARRRGQVGQPVDLAEPIRVGEGGEDRGRRRRRPVAPRRAF